MVITIRSVFKEDGKLYPQVFLDDILYKLNILKCQNTKELIFQKRLMLIKQIYHDLMQKAIGFNYIAIVYIKKMLTEFIFSI